MDEQFIGPPVPCGVRAFNFTLGNLGAGRSVYFTTYAKSLRYAPKHAPLVHLINGELWLQSGRRKFCVANRLMPLVAITAE